jgi:ABC-type nitrate/sulfonate/bicarbonate transport system permease component
MTAKLRGGAWLGLLPPLIVLIVWETMAEAGRLPDYLPAPSIIARQTLSMLTSGELMRHIGVSLYQALSGFAIGAFFGTVLGLLSGALRPVDRFYEPLISLTYPVPKIALLPLIFAWFGLGDLSKIVTITISVFYPIYISALAGAKSVSRVHIWAARNMGASAPQIIWRVLLPAALPQIFNGLRIGLALSFVVMFVAEMVESSVGLGYLILFAEQNLRFDMMYVAIVSIGAIGFGADYLLRQIGKRVLVGQLTSAEMRR